MRSLHIEEYSHYFKVTRFNVRTKPIVLSFAGRLVQLKLTPNPNRQSKKKFIPKPDRIYAGMTKDKTEFRFHIHQLPLFLEHLQVNGLYDRDIERVKYTANEGKAVDFPNVDTREPRDYQIPQIEYLESDQPITVLTTQTGRGKTFMALKAIRTLGRRVFLTLTKDTYISKWKEDVKEAYGLKGGPVVVVKGKDSLAGLIELAKNKEMDEVKFIICSSKTMAMFIDAYENQDMGLLEEYGCKPDELFELLDVGVKLIDEGHEHVHSTYRQFMYTHVRKSISLSATLVNDSLFVEKVIETMYPLSMRPKPTPYDKYIDVYNCTYSLSRENFRKINYKQRGMGSYSHVALEHSIMKSRELFKNYMGIVLAVAEELYFSKRKEGQKLLIFASTIDMCNMMVDHIKHLYPNEQIAKYTAEDDYETLLNTTIVISTLGSAGTGVDIPDLFTAISTVAVGSKVQNIQSLGRLRRLSRWPEVTPIFAYLSCLHISNHLDYHRKKLTLFSDKTKCHYEINTNLYL